MKQTFKEQPSEVWDKYVRMAEYAQEQGIRPELDTIVFAEILWQADVKYETKNNF